MKLGEQFNKIISQRIKQAKIDISKSVCNDIMGKTVENVNKGVAFGSDRYDRKYQPRSIKDRTSQGFQVSYVDLQRSNKRFQTISVKQNDSESHTIFFQQGGNLFYNHHIGIDYKSGKNYMRSIFPKTEQSIPNSVHKKAELVGSGVLNERK